MIFILHSNDGDFSHAGFIYVQAETARDFEKYLQKAFCCLSIATAPKWGQKQLCL